MAAVSQRARGFSMIELLVVMLIIIIVAAASIPAGLSFVRNYKIMGAAQNVATQVQRARSQAVKVNASRGILLSFNYPEAGQYQFTSLEPSPLTGNWDGNFYPANPGVFVPGVPDYGTVPTPPANIVDPNVLQGVQSPHGIPIDLPQDLAFDVGARNALLFRADGTVVPVNATGPVGDAVLVQDPTDPTGMDWMITLRDQNTNLMRIIKISPNGKVRIDEF